MSVPVSKRKVGTLEAVKVARNVAAMTTRLCSKEKFIRKRYRWRAGKMADCADEILLLITDANHVNVRKDQDNFILNSHICDRNKILAEAYRQTYRLEELMEIAIDVNRSVVSNQDNQRILNNWIKQIRTLRVLIRGMKMEMVYC